MKIAPLQCNHLVFNPVRLQIYLLLLCMLPSCGLLGQQFDQTDIYLRNDAVALGFSSESVVLAKIGNARTGYELIAPINLSSRRIWEVEFINQAQKKFSVSNLDGQKKSQRRYTQDGAEILEMTWADIPVCSDNERVDVIVTVTLPAVDDFSRWWIQVKNRTKSCGIWKIHFPIIERIGSGRHDTEQIRIAAPHFTGWLFSGPDELPEDRIEWNYPSAKCSMQFWCFYSGDSGFYIACHDSTASQKAFRLTKTQNGSEVNFTTVIYPSHMGEPARDFVLPYPVVIGTYVGNWYEGAKIYRKWATRQVWCSKGAIAGRADLPQWYKDLSLWCKFKNRKSPETAMDHVQRFRSSFTMPLALHWYIWHQSAFDDNYPHYFPPWPVFEETIQKFASKGVFFFPYINGRLWDTDTENWNQGIAGAAKNSDGSLYITTYGPRQNLATMCPSSSLWKNKIVEIVETLFHDYKVDGVYLDQVASAPPRLCFDTSHGHAPGGGTLWSSGYREILTSLKEIRNPRGENLLVSENNAEPWIDLIDGYLTWVPPLGNTVPLFQTVYSGYAITFGRRSVEEDLQHTNAFYMIQADLFVHGGVPGWITDVILKPQYKEQLEFLKQLAVMKNTAKKFLTEGELLKPLKDDDTMPKVEMTVDWFGKPLHIARPAVQHSVWAAQDGTIGLAMVNTAKQPIEFHYTLNMKNYGYAEDEVFKVSNLGESTEQAVINEGEMIERIETLKPHEVCVLEIIRVEE